MSTKVLARKWDSRCLGGSLLQVLDADWFREQVSEYCDEVIVTEDHGQNCGMRSLK